jgi:hypothetical protein
LTLQSLSFNLFSINGLTIWSGHTSPVSLHSVITFPASGSFWI